MAITITWVLYSVSLDVMEEVEEMVVVCCLSCSPAQLVWLLNKVLPNASHVRIQ